MEKNLYNFIEVIKEYNLEKEFIDFFNNIYLKKQGKKEIKEITNLQKYYYLSYEFHYTFENSKELLAFLKGILEKKNYVLEEELFQEYENDKDIVIARIYKIEKK